MLEAYRTHKLLDALEARLDNEAAEVLAEVRDLLDDQPANERALLILARCQAHCGDPGAAKQTYETLVEQAPDHVDAKCELARLLYAENDVSAAISLLQEATKQAPELADNWKLLAGYLHDDGQSEAEKNALSQYEMIRSFNEGLLAAQTAFANGEIQKANRLCRHLLQKVPGEIRTLRVLAGIATRLRYYEDGISILDRCLQSRPYDPALRLNYAQALLAGKKFREALVQCDHVTDLAPETVDIYQVQAEALYNLGQYEDAMAIFQELSTLEGKRAPSLVSLGKVATTVGETKRAIEYFRQALEERPVPCQAYWELASLKTYRFSATEIDRMERLSEAGDLSEMDGILIRYALGRALEDEARYADSFGHIEAANTAYARYQPSRYESRNDALKSFFTADYFSASRGRGSDSTAPVFVVGMPRSGSTLVEQILSAHSEVDATAELTEIVSIARELDGQGRDGKGQYPESLARLEDRQVQDYAQRYLDFVLPLRTGGEFFIDKTPGNFHHLGLIKTMFPRAKIVDIRRHPMASGWSLYKHFFADSFQFSYDLETLGRYFNDYLDLMDHWHSALPGQILTLHYEDLVNDLPAAVDSLLKYCSLPFEQGCVDFHQNPRAVATPSSEQVRSPLYSSALEHWKNYEAFLGPLRRVLDQRQPAPGG